MHVLVNISGAPKAPVTPNGDATAFEQRSENLSARCELPTASLQRP